MVEEDQKETLELIERIGFHERKASGYRIPFIETYIYVRNLMKFLELCFGEKWNDRFDGKSSIEWNIKRLEKSKAKRPKFDILINQKRVDIYPRENLIVGREGGIHYICQHSFDMLPIEAREIFYGYDFDEFIIGKLYPLSRKGIESMSMNVTNKDILMDSCFIEKQ